MCSHLDFAGNRKHKYFMLQFIGLISLIDLIIIGHWTNKVFWDRVLWSEFVASSVINPTKERGPKTLYEFNNRTRRLCVLANTKLYHQNLLLWISMKYWILVSTTLGLFSKDPPIYPNTHTVDQKWNLVLPRLHVYTPSSRLTEIHVF